MENEHCMLLALPCGHDHIDVLKQNTNLTHGFITYLQQKQAAGIVNVPAPGTTQPVSILTSLTLESAFLCGFIKYFTSFTNTFEFSEISLKICFFKYKL